MPIEWGIGEGSMSSVTLIAQCNAETLSPGGLLSGKPV